MASVDPKKFLYPIVSLGADGQAEYLRGNAFPVTTDGSLLMCRHVTSAAEGTTLAVLDLETGQSAAITNVVYPRDPSLDVAFLPGVLGRETHRLPLLPPENVLVDQDVYTPGFYSPSSRIETVADGYFKGNIVRVQTVRGYSTATLSYPIIEGLSGSPVLQYYNGVKLIGMCFGSESQRVLAAEVVEVDDGEMKYRETVNRIVEFGLAYRSETLETFLASTNSPPPVVTAERFLDDELA